MQRKHLLLAILVTLVWGVNFPISKIGLKTIDPIVLTGIRFSLAAFPLVFFVKRPNVSFSYLATYGVIFGVAMWALINIGIEIGVPPGVASLVIQLSAFFTMAWGALIFKEKIRAGQVAGVILAFVGLTGILLTRNGSHEFWGVILVVLSAVSWSVGNVVIKKSGVKEIFSFTVWASLFPPIPLFLIAYAQHGSAVYLSLVEKVAPEAIFSLVFQVYLATHFSYWGWNSLLRKYPISTVAPLSLLIPVFGIVSSVLIIGERVSSPEAISMLIIISGLFVGLIKKGVRPFMQAEVAPTKS
ncbi:EamA family transporter [Chromobacterium vaccinii]|uniref:EamA family transporter n=1 Tax=Chromobacterium vaccinii TaxID=1108595 RepID=UPI001E2E4509|nr:EamA family transporter [Chromobacterium vaccinii]MCD4483867.1 EamA family transporter [Chromobacterium vaccinii]